MSQGISSIAAFINSLHNWVPLSGERGCYIHVQGAVRFGMLNRNREINQYQSDDKPADQLKSKVIGQSTEDHWQECLRLIAGASPKDRAEQLIKTWFLPIKPLRFVDNTLFLSVESQFFGEWLDSHYRPVLVSAVRTVFGDDARLDFVVKQPDPSEKKASKEPNATEPVVVPSPTKPQEKVGKIPGGYRLNPQFVFENFFAAGLSYFAKKAAEHVAQNPGAQLYNPFYIHGARGTGKTHILHAIGNSLSDNYDNKKVVYMTAESFVHGYITAIQGQRINKFIAAMRSLDVLLLDNFHFLAGKMKSQEALLLILQDLLQRNKQVVLAGNVPPNLLPRFNSGLVAIAQNGLIADLHHTEVLEREGIIRHYLAKNGVTLEEAAVQFLAKSMGNDIHHLHTVLVRIIAQISILQKNLELNEIRFIVNQLCPQSEEVLQQSMPKRALRIADIIKAVSTYFDVPEDKMRGISRKQRISKARQIAIYLCRELTDESLNTIGYHFSNLHHASVLYAYNKVANDIKTNPRLRNHIDKIRAMI